MINKKLKFAFLLAGGFSFAQDVSVIKNTSDIYSSSHFGGTAKFNAMAGSMGALGGDLSAIAINPAGVGVFISGDLSATLGVQTQTNHSTLFGKSYESSYSKVNVGQIGAVLSFKTLDSSPWKFVNLAFNYSSKNIDDYVRTPDANSIRESITYTNSNNANVTDNLLFNGHAYDRVGSLSNMSIALGGNYENKFYLGGAINIKNAEIQQADFFQLKMQNLGETAYYDKQYTPYHEVANGVNLTLGIIGKVNKNIRLGFAIETPTFWTLQRSYTEYGTNVADVWVSDVFDEDRKLSSPMKATLSAAVVANKNFSLNIDYTLGLTKPRYKQYGEAERQLNSFFSSQYANASDLRLGGEYRVNGLRLRAGYAMEKNPFKAESLVAFNSNGISGNTLLNNPFIGDRTTVSGGIGYDFKSFYIDGGYQSITSSYDNSFFGGKYAVTANNGFSIVDGDGVDNGASIVSQVKNTRTHLFLTVGCKF